MSLPGASPQRLAEMLVDARQRTLELISDLDGKQLFGPRLPIVNPLLWEIGHVAWFQEWWTLRQTDGVASILDPADALYNSSIVSQATRWDLPLPSRAATLEFMDRVLNSSLERLESIAADDPALYFYRLALFHEDMHAEAICMTRQTHGYAVPALARTPTAPAGGGPLPGDVDVAGTEFQLGAPHGLPFVFDNEKWTHPVRVEPFQIARAAVTQGELASFVEDRGYEREDLWSPAGWEWKQRFGAAHPVYWARESGRWFSRRFDELVPLEEHLPVLHLNWFEADAYCRWARRRLPTEPEWELAASTTEKSPYPWGQQAPDRSLANLDASYGGCVEVGAIEAGESAVGCRQMLGNVWEWTASDFLPYPDFQCDPYTDYSKPWFGTHKVLRGGCWFTRSRLIRNTWRNFYTPDRRDVWAGFRTCAVGE